jgi:secretion/DNA translocation related CpaE-like protein
MESAGSRSQGGPGAAVRRTTGRTSVGPARVGREVVSTAGQGRVVAVVGACGGAGASTLAAAVAHRLRRDGERATLVDLDLPGPGVDVLLGIEEAAGARWPELAAARGDVDGTGVLAALPRWGTVPVLSGSRLAVDPPSDAVVVDVCTGLLRAGESVVLDLPRLGAWTPASRSLVAAADASLLVTPLTVRGAAGAVAVASALAASGARAVRVVARRPAPGRVDVLDLERALGRTVVATARWDSRVAAAVERGEGPPVGRRTALGRVAADVVGSL